MKSKEEFKLFVKSHPELVNYVKSNEMTWQKFYELYSLYDEDNSIWDKYINKTIEEDNEKNIRKDNNKFNDVPGISEIFSMFKNVKPETIQQNINSVQKFLGFVSDFVGEDKNKQNNKPRNIYTPRPTHKMFED